MLVKETEGTQCYNVRVKQRNSVRIGREVTLLGRKAGKKNETAHSCTSAERGQRSVRRPERHQQKTFREQRKRQKAFPIDLRLTLLSSISPRFWWGTETQACSKTRANNSSHTHSSRHLSVLQQQPFVDWNEWLLLLQKEREREQELFKQMREKAASERVNEEAEGESEKKALVIIKMKRKASMTKSQTLRLGMCSVLRVPGHRIFFPFPTFASQ